MPTLKTLVSPSQNLTIKFLYARALGFAACRSALPLSQSEATERTSGRKKVRERCFFAFSSFLILLALFLFTKTLFQVIPNDGSHDRMLLTVDHMEIILFINAIDFHYRQSNPLKML